MHPPHPAPSRFTTVDTRHALSMQLVWRTASEPEAVASFLGKEIDAAKAAMRRIHLPVMEVPTSRRCLPGPVRVTYPSEHPANRDCNRGRDRNCGRDRSCGRDRDG